MSLADPDRVRLPQLPRTGRGRVLAIDWHELTEPEGRRLRELGLDEGVEVELLRGSGILGGPVACRIGRMIVALRRHVAGAIHVSPLLG